MEASFNVLLNNLVSHSMEVVFLSHCKLASKSKSTIAFSVCIYICTSKLHHLFTRYFQTCYQLVQTKQKISLIKGANEPPRHYLFFLINDSQIPSITLTDEISLFLREVSPNVSATATFGSKGKKAKTDKVDDSLTLVILRPI
jgi:hypothetical protein